MAPNTPSARSVWELKDPLGNPRYFVPGQHPAAARMREQLAEAERLKADRTRKSSEDGVEYDTGPVEEFIEYLREQLALFEARESELKARDDWMLRDREEDR